MIKQQLIAVADKNELTLLSFTREQAEQELKWEHEGEFEYKGQMYDIIEKEIKSDRIIFLCWKDDKETKLNKQLNQLITQSADQDQQNRTLHNHLNDYFKSLFHSTLLDWQACNDQAVVLFPFSGNMNILPFSITPPFPPPRKT